LLFAGCSGSDETQPDAGDGKVHPAPNGVRISETDACGTIETALLNRGLTLGCSMTVRPCPQLLRAQFTTACMQYDQGTVSGCASYFDALSSCAGLDSEACVVIPYPGTEPAGCP
jgi:hypothetical protein